VFSHRVAAVVIVLAALMTATSTAALAQEPDSERFPRIRLLQGLQSSNAVVRATAMESLEEHGLTPEVADVLITVLDKQYNRRTRLRSTTLDMLRLLADIDTDMVAAAMLKYLDAAHYEFIVAAADHLSRRGDQRALEPLLAMHQRAEFAQTFGLRRAVTDSLARYRDKRVVEYALARLPESQGTMRHNLLRYLMRVSRQQFGADHTIWNVWWTDNRDDFEFPEPETEPESEDAQSDAKIAEIKGYEVPRYYDFPIYARRVVFVLDRSDSMSAGEEMSKLESAKVELKTAVNGLAEQVYFGIVLFDARVRNWNRELIAADDKSKQAAARYIDGISAGQGTNTYEALLEALQMDGNTEAVFFLSDGAANDGDITEPDDIVKAIATENYFRRATVYSIGVGVTGETGTFMRSLAAETGGVYHRVGGDPAADDPIAGAGDVNSGLDETGRPAGGRTNRGDAGRRDAAGRPINDVDS